MKPVQYGVGAIAAGLLALSAAATAGAETFGSASIVTLRSCVNPGAACTFTTPALQFSERGGIGQAVNDYRDFGGGNISQGSLSFTDGLLPTIRTYASAGDDRRTGANFFAFRSYTWDGEEAIDLALKASLHYVTSGDLLAGEHAGEGNLAASLSIVGTDFLTALGPNPNSTAIQNCYFTCGTRYAGAPGTSFGTIGDNTIPINVPAVRINPGQTFVVLAGVQSFANRGGYIDALSTFDVDFDLDNTRYALSGELVGGAALQQSIESVVPEPATWALMIGGFGLAGGALRRRRALPV